MRAKHVRCDRCGEQAIVMGEEGEIFPRNSKARSKTVLIIDCPKCGRREQPANNEDGDSTQGQK